MCAVTRKNRGFLTNTFTRGHDQCFRYKYGIERFVEHERTTNDVTNYRRIRSEQIGTALVADVCFGKQSEKIVVKQ